MGQKKSYPFSLGAIPLEVRTRLYHRAERIASETVQKLEDNPRVKELFWVAFYFEYRLSIERWIQENA